MSVAWRRTVRKAIHLRSEYARCFLAEFLGTMVLVFLIDAMAAHAIFNTILPGRLERRPADQVHLALGAAMAVLVGVLVSGGVSGAHLNPALSAAFALMGRMPWKKMLVYMAAQYLGALVASAGLYAIYHETFDMYDGGVRQVGGENGTAAIFSTYPAQHLSWTTAFFDQIVATSVLMFGVLAIIDEKNWQIPKNLIPLYIALLIMSIVLSLGYNTGAAMNPARDLMPRLFTYLAGWGVETFSVWDYTWFWIPILGSHLGAILGAAVYEVLIGAHWPDGKPPMPRTTEDDLDMQFMRPASGVPAPVFKVRPSAFSPAHESSDPKRALLTNTHTSVA